MSMRGQWLSLHGIQSARLGLETGIYASQISDPILFICSQISDPVQLEFPVVPDRRQFANFAPVNRLHA
jgi:hypothetical protein